MISVRSCHPIPSRRQQQSGSSSCSWSRPGQPLTAPPRLRRNSRSQRRLGSGGTAAHSAATAPEGQPLTAPPPLRRDSRSQRRLGSGGTAA
ncbi:hypothetical protein chiPu_0033008, partial [Chiloscyllium punctatum]|nr:hypothetical protein [Chiloscyllium punctatum]